MTALCVGGKGMGIVKQSYHQKPYELDGLLKLWASWKLCRLDRDSDLPPKEFAPMAGSSKIPCSKVPPRVWMTPTFQVIEYQAITEAWEELPQKEHDVILLKYLWEIVPPRDSHIARVVGCSPSGVEHYRVKACKLIRSRLDGVPATHWDRRRRLVKADLEEL